MNYEESLQNVSVLGAAGKMGSGIVLLTAAEMADLSLKPENKGKTFVLHAIDVSDEALSGLMRYLKTQVVKVAEKKGRPGCPRGQRYREEHGEQGCKCPGRG